MSEIRHPITFYAVPPVRIEMTREEIERSARRRALYEPTLSHADLSDFDAIGMDFVEGRR